MYIRLISIMTVAVSVKTFEATRSQLQSPVLYARGLTRGRRKMMEQRVRVQANNTKELGPISLPVSDCQITEELREQIYGRFGVDAVIARKKQWGILVGPTCTRQCKACFGQDEVYAVRSPYPVCSTSSVCSARVHPARSTRSNPSRVFFSMMICWRSTGPLCGWLLMVGRTYVVYYPRSAAPQQPSYKFPWTPGRPATDTSVAPVSPAATTRDYSDTEDPAACPRNSGGHRIREVWGTRKRAMRCP